MEIFSKNNSPNDEFDYESQRMQMVDKQIARRNVLDKHVLQAMRTVPRHLFVPEQYRDQAYEDGPLPIGYEQTISQPYIVASMTEELEIDADSRVLEVGTGCGYQTAILAEIAHQVFSIEIIPGLLSQADALLRQLDYVNIKTMLGDGSQGWDSESPFDGILVAAAAKQVPEQLLKQLAVGGTILIPVGKLHSNQQLIKIKRTQTKLTTEALYPVRFVPLVDSSP